MRRLVLAAMLVAVLVPAATSSVALAQSGEPADEPTSTATLTDAAGDVARPRGDAIRAELVHSPSTMTVTMQMRSYADPLESPGWVIGDSTIVISIVTRDDPGPDWSVVLRHESGHFVGRVVRESDHTIVCSGEAFSIVDSATYGFSFPRTCVDRPGRARFFGTMRWDRQPGPDTEGRQIDEVTGKFGPADRLSRWTYAPCATQHSSTLEFGVEDTSLNEGAKARFHLRIKRQGTATGIRYERLELHRRLEGSDTWTTVDTGRANAGGRIEMTDVPPDDAHYRAHHPASSCANDLTTPILHVIVQ